MTLNEWRTENGLSYSALAEMLSTSRRQVTPEAARRWCLPEEHGLARMPDRPMLRRIRMVTLASVTADDFLYE